MNATEQKEIEERIRALDDHALLRLVAVEALEYHQRSESLDVGLEIARDELQRRQVGVLSAEQYYRRFPGERKSWRKTARKLRVDLLWLAGAIGGIAVPLLILTVALDKKWISDGASEGIIRWGAIAFGLTIVLPAIRKARTIDRPNGDLLGKEAVISCVAFGFVASLVLIARIVYLRNSR
jgi:hypothetical protein